MDLIILLIAIFGSLAVYRHPVVLMPLTLVFIGQLMGDIKFSIMGKTISPLGVYFYSSICLLTFKFRVDLLKLFNIEKLVLVSKKKAFVSIVVYAISFYIPELYSYYSWGTVNPLFWKLQLFSILSFLFIFYISKSKKGGEDTLSRDLAFCFLLIVLVTLPQAVDFFISTGGKGLGRFRGYRATKVIFEHIGMIQLGGRYYLFQVTLPVCLMMILTLPSFYGYCHQRFSSIKNLLFYFVFTIVSTLTTIFFYINQYFKQVLYNGLLLLSFGVVGALFFRKGNTAKIIFLIILGTLAIILPLSFDKDVKSFVRKNFRQVRSVIDEDKPFYLISQINVGSYDDFTEVKNYPNRVTLYARVIKNWYNHCFFQGCGPQGYIEKIGESGKVYRLRTSSYHSTVIDNFTNYGVFIGLVANGFFVFLILYPILFRWHDGLNWSELFILSATLYTIVFICVFEEQWGSMPHLRFVCLSLFFVVTSIVEKLRERVDQR